MKTHIRPFRLWWCMFGVWWMVLQRLTLRKPCKSLEQSGMEGNEGICFFCVKSFWGGGGGNMNAFLPKYT